MSKECCKDCGVSLVPDQEICPVCGTPRSEQPFGDLSISDEYLNVIERHQVPDSYPGY